MTRHFTVLLARHIAGCAARITPAPRSALRKQSACFHVDSLPAFARTLAARVLLESSDGEALYTLAGALKPL